MSDTPLRQSPLAQFVSENRATVPTREGSVLLTEIPLLGYVNLRGNPNEQRFLKAVEKTLGVNLPLKPNTGSVTNTVSVLWLAPDEWLLITPSDQETQLVQTLGDSLGQIPTSVTDITGSQTLL
ncbi:MAG: sarcosine oxidase subunit gamma family protein, partial [SAR202 cluster bacterium]|nr:sarcosine oxidase subunit gamma family protein [SAR202 cluster bacterium]